MPRVPSSKSVSIKDVAELAGVSLGSASRVINKASNVTAETREKVEQAIAALGYRPNHAAQSLRLRTTRTVGCLLTDVSNPLYANLFRAFEERMRAVGYMTLLANSLNLPEREIDILSAFKSRGMDGVVIAPGNERDPQVLATIRELGMPTVILDRDMDTRADRVLFDHVPGMKQVVEHLGRMGHRRMALITTESSHRPIRRRTEGFRAGHKAQGLVLDEELVVRLPSAMSPAFEAVSILLSRPDRPTAIVAMGTTILNETLNAISARHLRIPQDISVVSIGDPAFAASYVPPLSCLRVDLDVAAHHSSTLLLQRFHEGDATVPPRTSHIPCEFIERASCGPPPRRSSA
jgi:LacI family transcriptional regulator